MLLDLYRRKVQVLSTSTLGLPGLRGGWLASDFDENGNLFDISEQDRVLSYTGNPLFGYDDYIPRVTLDGTGDYFTRADEAGLDITGTETYIETAYRGLSMGGWFTLSTLANYAIFMSKWMGLNDLSYALWFDQPAVNLAAAITSGGSAATQLNIASSITPVVNTWYFLAMTFDPSTSLNMYVNDTKDSVTVGVPANVFSGAAAFEIGNAGSGAGAELAGKFSAGFLCSMFLSDEIIFDFFAATRDLYGI